MVSRGTIAVGPLMADALDKSAGKRRRSLQADVETLTGVPLFAGLSRRHLRKLAQQMDEVHVRGGRTIVEAGLRGDAFFVLVAGGAKVYTTKATSGRPKARLGPGDFFGEMAVLDGAPRSATVVADGAVTLLRLTRSAFIKMISQEPTVSIAIMAGLAERLRRGAPTD